MQKTYRIIIVFITVSLLGIGSWSCQWHTIEPLEVVVSDDADPVLFSTQIQPIFDANCNSCHDSQSPVLTSDVSYNNLINGNFVNTGDAASSEIITKITGGHFATYSNEEETLLVTWIQQGAENN